MIIYKYSIKDGTNKIRVTQNSKVLSAGLDLNNDLCVWIMIQPHAGDLDICITVIFTGEEFYPTENSFIATVKDDTFVYHIFAN